MVTRAAVFNCKALRLIYRMGRDWRGTARKRLHLLFIPAGRVAHIADGTLKREREISWRGGAGEHAWLARLDPTW